jgi:DNA polymerase delta subunit 1
MLHVTDFLHYLYVAAPVSFSPHDCEAFKAYLEAQVGQFQPAIQVVQMVMRENLYGFQGNQQNPYLKITVTDPKHIGRVRAKIENGEANWKGMWKGADGVLTFDMIQYVLRFMVDCKVSICVPDIEQELMGVRSLVCLGSRFRQNRISSSPQTCDIQIAR